MSLPLPNEAVPRYRPRSASNALKEIVDGELRAVAQQRTAGAAGDPRSGWRRGVPGGGARQRDDRRGYGGALAGLG